MRIINVTAKDGAAISAIAYSIDEPGIKGVVIASHGFGEHAGMYAELGELLEQAGYAGVLFDQRGHGKPPDDRKNWFGVISDYQCFLDDISSVTAAVAEAAPGVPIILYGHSMGGNIVVNTLLRQPSGYLCAVLESPWLGLYNPPGALMNGIAKIAGRLSPNFAIDNKLTVSNITGDSGRHDRYLSDPVYHNRISLRMFTGVKGGCAYALENAVNLSVPVYLGYASNERIVSNPAIKQFIEGAGDMVTPHEYESCHAIHNDLKRDEFYADMIAYLDAKCRAGSPD